MKQSLWIKTTLAAMSALIIVLTGCADLSEPEEINGIRCTLTVLDSVGGSRISEPSEVTVYNASGRKLYSKSVSGGRAELRLLKDNLYTIKLAGRPNKLAASAIENYKFRSAVPIEITMYQRSPQREAPTIAPTVHSVELDGRSLKDGSEFITTFRKTLRVEFKAPARAIRSSPQNQNFGCAFAIGSVPSFFNNIAATDALCQRAADGSWHCTADFKLDSFEPADETADLIIVAYDVAGNRIERHINDVQFKQKSPAWYDMQNVTIENFAIEMSRHPHSLGLFETGMPKQEGRSTSVEAKLHFRVKRHGTDLAIRGYDIFRRQAEAGQSADMGWQLVGRKKYNGESAGITKTAQGQEKYLGFHTGYDTDPLLEEGILYEYKVRIYTDTTHFLDSSIATARILPAFTIHLESPADNSAVKQSDSDNLEFSFKISNPQVIKTADYFTFGLLISEKSSNSTVIFAGKARIMLKEQQPQRRLSFFHNTKYYPLSMLQEKGIIPKTLAADSLITLEGDTVTIKKAFLHTKEFNMAKNAAQVKFDAGVTYNWDILDWGKDAAAWRDDEPATFTAEWPTRAANGALLPDVKSFSDSFANHLHSYSAINGKIFFKITDN